MVLGMQRAKPISAPSQIPPALANSSHQTNTAQNNEI